MIKWALILGFVILVGDPILLFYIYMKWGLAETLLTVVLPLLFGPQLVRACKNSQPRAEHPVGALGDDLLFLAASLLFIFPGPLSTLCALLLLVTPVRRMIQARAVRAFNNALRAGNVTMVSNLGGVSVSSGFGAGAPFGAAPMPQNLKPVEGRVVDDAPPLLDSPKY